MDGGNRVNKNPAGLVERAGFGKRNLDVDFDSANYLPASLESLPMPSRLGPASDADPFEGHSMPWNNPTAIDHRVGCGCLGYVALMVMCEEISDLISAL